MISDLGDVEASMAERLDDQHYRDDVLRLLFICCHPDLPANQQIALALRIVSGLTVKEIARAFLASGGCHGAAHHPRQAPHRRSRRALRGAGCGRAVERLGVVAAMVYLLFNEGYSASGGEAHIRLPLCEEAIRLARLLLQLFPGEPEIMGLTALLLLQHARAGARLDADGAIVLLEDQDRASLGPRADRRRHGADREGDAPPPAGAVTRSRRRSPRCTMPPPAPRIPTGPRSTSSMRALERLQPSPVVSLNRAVAVAKLQGPEAALAMIEPLAGSARQLFPFSRAEGRLAEAGRPRA